MIGKKGFQKGYTPWNKGKKLSEETKLKMSGRTPWNKGLKNESLSKRQKENNISKRPEVRKKMSESKKRFFENGGRPWNWDGGHSKNRKYVQEKWKKLIKEIYVRDNYTCQTCGKSGGNLNAHHIKPWSRYPELAFNKENIITLCIPCHSRIHVVQMLKKRVLTQGVTK